MGRSIFCRTLAACDQESLVVVQSEVTLEAGFRIVSFLTCKEAQIERHRYINAVLMLGFRRAIP